jgi:hypothetical protein
MHPLPLLAAVGWQLDSLQTMPVNHSATPGPNLSKCLWMRSTIGCGHWVWGTGFLLTDTSVRFMKVVVVVGGRVVVVVGGRVVLLVLVVVTVVCVGRVESSAPPLSEAMRVSHASATSRIMMNTACFIGVWVCLFKGLLSRGIERLSRGQGRQRPTTIAISPAATTWCGSLREVSVVRYLPYLISVSIGKPKPSFHSE